jgi:hypothetical protein
MVRCGIILYGLEHKDGKKSLPEGVRQLLTLKGRIIKIQNIKAGEPGGYGNKFIAKGYTNCNNWFRLWRQRFTRLEGSTCIWPKSTFSKLFYGYYYS